MTYLTGFKGLGNFEVKLSASTHGSGMGGRDKENEEEEMAHLLPLSIRYFLFLYNKNILDLIAIKLKYFCIGVISCFKRDISKL